MGRGGSGKSTGLAELVWRARSQGRDVIVGDGDARSRTLTGLFPEAVHPVSEEFPDVSAFLSSLLNRIVKEHRSAVLDLGGGDRSLVEYGRDLNLVAFCQRREVEPLALYFLGPDPEDLAHVVSIWRGGFFRPARAVLILNEGVVRSGKTVAGAFERTLASPDFTRMVEEGARPLLMHRLAVFDQVKASGVGLYGAAVGEAGLDPVEEFMVSEWVERLETRREEAGIRSWLP